MSKLKSTPHIEVEINLDEMDLSRAESKATYEEIKEYVLKNYGMNVTNLYIAQVKENMELLKESIIIWGKEKQECHKLPQKRKKL